MKSIGYIRVSTEEQANEGVSLEAQRAKIRMYCELNDLLLTDIIEDAGKSGKNLNRPGIQKLMDMIDKKDVETIVVYKLDRLSRGVKDTLQLMDMIEKKGIAFHSISEKIDTKTAIGKFFLNILASMNQWERDTISERTRDALQYKKRNGECVGQTPYGWKKGKAGKLVEIPEEQDIILYVKELKNDGLNVHQICAELTRKGISPNGMKWRDKTIRNILKR